MKTLLLIFATLLTAGLARAGFIVGNTGFTVYDDPAVWTLSHPNALTVDLSGTPTGQYSTNLAIGEVAITGYQLYFGQVGNNQTLISDTSQGIGVGISISPLLNITSLSFYLTPLPFPASDWTQIIVDAGPGQLDYYQSLNAPFFFGVDSPSRIDYVHLAVGLGSPVTALALDSVQTDTPEPSTVQSVGGSVMLLLVRVARSKNRRS